MDDITVVHCENCHHPLAIVRSVGGVEVLQIGSLILRAAHGSCFNCGTVFHWDVGSAALARLIQHVIDLRNGKSDV